MISLKENSPELKRLFEAVHLPINGHRPGQALLNEYIDLCASTNEIIKLERRFSHSLNRYFISPVHVQEAKTPMMLRGVLGKNQSDAVQKAELIDLYKPFNARKYWEIDDFKLLDALMVLDDPEEIMRDAFIVADRILKRSPQHLSIVCGPISGGKRTKEQNLQIFNRAIFEVSQEENIFNQLPFEKLFQKVQTLLHTTHRHFLENESALDFIMETFYLKVFRSGKAWKAYFIEGWRHSQGACFEYNFFTDHCCQTSFIMFENHAIVFALAS
jgi:hypothetical protein